MDEVLKPYPEYKESGVPWLGRVPVGWEIHPNRALFFERNRKNNTEQNLLSVVIKRGVIPQKELITNTSKKDSSNEDKSNYKLVLKGDLAYNKMRMWQGAVGASDYDGIVSPAYIIVRPRKAADPWYYHFLFRTPVYTKESHRFSYGICDDQMNLRFEDFKKIYSPEPPLEEQWQIVKFIKFKSSQISRFIRAKKRMIELLKEQKQAIINDAVTGKIDVRTGKPYPKYKESGVEWLGKVPEGWEAIKIGYVIDILPGYAFPSQEFSHNINDTRLLRGINIAPGSVRWNDVVYLHNDKYNDYCQFQLQGGDLVVGMDRPWVANGMRVAEVREEDLPCLLLQRVARIRAKSPLLQQYLSMLLQGQSFLSYFEPILTGISVPHISENQIKAFRFPLPPQQVQLEILNFINTSTTSIQSAILRTQREISLLTEYRTRLIADVVTGKIDVSNITVSDIPTADSQPETDSAEMESEDLAIDTIEPFETPDD